MSLDDLVLCAELEDGTLIQGESQIPIMQQKLNKRINKVFIKPKNCKALDEAIYEIENADVIILGPVACIPVLFQIY